MSPSISDLIAEMAAVASRKRQDYAAEDDALSNFRCMEDAGVPAWVYALARLREKACRAAQHRVKGEFRVSDEGMRELGVDIAVLALLMVQLYCEASPQECEPPQESPVRVPVYQLSTEDGVPLDVLREEVQNMIRAHANRGYNWSLSGT